MDELDVVSGASLRPFVARWYGPPDRPPSGRSLPPSLPAAMTHWYEVAARWSVPLSRDHHVPKPEDLPVRDGATIFWTDEEGTECWGYEGDETDPAVLESIGGEPWADTGIALSRFLVYVAVYEAVYAPLHGLVRLDATPPEIEAVAGRLWALEDPLWQWPDPTLRFYADDDLLAHAGMDQPAGGRLVVSARHRDALSRFDGYGLSWDWDSRTAS